MHAKSKNLKNLARLRNRREFLAVRNHNCKYARPGLVLQAAPCQTAPGNGVHQAPEQDWIRFGVTVSTRVDKRAVIRNRARRRLRSLARDILPMTAQPGYDYVLIGRKGTATRPYTDLARDLETCLEKLGLSRQGDKA